MNICEILNKKEKLRQKQNINLIASENYLPKKFLKLAGNYFLNKYAEGYPNKRYYNGCENVDQLEILCIKEACKLFSSNFANVQPHSGTQANQAVLNALLKPYDKILYLDLKHGGHLSHGFKSNFSGKYYNTKTYIINQSGHIDKEYFQQIFLEFKPNLVIFGFSSYVFDIDFEYFYKIINKQAFILADISHTSGLIVSKLLNNPFPWVDIIVTTTHKSLFGPRGGLILWNDQKFSELINKSVFPGVQGGPNMGDVLLKLNSFEYVKTNEYQSYAKQVIKNSNALYNILKKNNINVMFGTENHICLINYGKNAKEMVKKLEEYKIIANVNYIYTDKKVPTGIRLGTYAMTTRGFKENDFEKLGELIKDIITEKKQKKDIKKEIKLLLKKCTNDKLYF